MLYNIKTFFKHLFTEPDNKTFCVIRVLSATGVFVFFGLAIQNYRQHAVFDPLGFAGGFGGMVTGVGAALKLKKDSPTDSGQNGQ